MAVSDWEQVCIEPGGLFAFTATLFVVEVKVKAKAISAFNKITGFFVSAQRLSVLAIVDGIAAPQGYKTYYVCIYWDME